MNGVEARALTKLVLEGIAASHHMIGRYRCRELAILYHRDAGMISTIDDLYRKINSEVQQFCFVRGAILLPRCSSEVVDSANPDDCH